MTMRESNHSDPRLTRALRHLGEASAQDAPPEVGLVLRSAFRSHHARRRRTRRIVTAALAACLVVSLSVVSLKTGIVSRPGSHSPQVTSAPGSLSPAPAVAGSGPAIQTTARALPATHPAHHNRTPSAKVEHSFLALPAYAQAAPGEELRIVRLKLTGSALRLLGAPVSEESSDRQVLADFVIGQDGTPYAVRLAQP